MKKLFFLCIVTTLLCGCNPDDSFFTEKGFNTVELNGNLCHMVHRRSLDCGLFGTKNGIQTAS